jgi:hypothetical protein
MQGTAVAHSDFQDVDANPASIAQLQIAPIRMPLWPIANPQERRLRLTVARGLNTTLKARSGSAAGEPAPNGIYVLLR